MTNKPFDPTKPVQYRNGEPARILCTDGKAVFQSNAFPLISETSGGRLMTHKISGEIYVTGIDGYDLVNIPAKHKLTGLASAYDDGSFLFHRSKQTADSYIVTRIIRIACLDLSKYNIEFEEGEGL